MTLSLINHFEIHIKSLYFNLHFPRGIHFETVVQDFKV